MSFHNMQKQTTVEWKRSDVHEWSKELAQTITTQFPDLPTTINTMEINFDIVKGKLQSAFVTDTYVHAFLRMCESRKGIKDKDVLNISCGGCLVMVYCLLSYNKFDVSLMRVFRDLMYDMGTTCLQGYTHRMLSFIIALLRDMSVVPTFGTSDNTTTDIAIPTVSGTTTLCTSITVPASTTANTVTTQQQLQLISLANASPQRMRDIADEHARALLTQQQQQQQQPPL